MALLWIHSKRIEGLSFLGRLCELALALQSLSSTGVLEVVEVGPRRDVEDAAGCCGAQDGSMLKARAEPLPLRIVPRAVRGCAQ